MEDSISSQREQRDEGRTRNSPSLFLTARSSIPPIPTLSGKRGLQFIQETKPASLIGEFIPRVLCAIYALGGSANPKEVMKRVRYDCEMSQEAWDVPWYNTQSGKVYYAMLWSIRKMRQTGHIVVPPARWQKDEWIISEKAMKDMDSWLNPDNWEAFRETMKPFFGMPGMRSRKGAQIIDSDEHPPEDLKPEEKPKSDLSKEDALKKILNHLDPDDIRARNGRKVENLLKIVLEKAGYVNCSLTQKGSDGGIDGWAYLPGRGLRRIRTAFQCKSGDSRVSGPVMDQFIGICSTKRNDCEGIFLSIEGFSASATHSGNQAGIRLVDGNELLDMMAEFEVWDTLRGIPGYEELVKAYDRLYKKKGGKKI